MDRDFKKEPSGALVVIVNAVRSCRLLGDGCETLLLPRGTSSGSHVLPSAASGVHLHRGYREVMSP